MLNTKQIEKWTLEVKCSGEGTPNEGCGNTFLVNEDTIFPNIDESYKEGCSRLECSTRCPKCKALTAISKWSIPQYIKRRAQEKAHNEVESTEKVLREVEELDQP